MHSTAPTTGRTAPLRRARPRRAAPAKTRCSPPPAAPASAAKVSKNPRSHAEQAVPPHPAGAAERGPQIPARCPGQRPCGGSGCAAGSQPPAQNAARAAGCRHPRPAACRPGRHDRSCPAAPARSARPPWPSISSGFVLRDPPHGRGADRRRRRQCPLPRGSPARRGSAGYCPRRRPLPRRTAARTVPTFGRPAGCPPQTGPSDPAPSAFAV